LGISIDVTTRKKAENEYKEWLHKLEQSQRLESLGLLASSIAHDFNNILQGVIGNISLANELLSENPQAKHLVLRAQDSAEKAAEITTQLLSYSGKNSCEKKMIDLTETVREAYKLVERLSAKKADIRFDVSLRPLPIFADIRKLRQVVLNLITNAIDSFKSKRGLIYIRTYSATREELLDLNLEVINEIRLDNYAIFEIEDNGSGIPANILERIFEPFFSTKVSGKGIGLAACQGIIKLHEGFIGVSSTVGSGTSFTIGLPLQSSAEIASNLNSSTQLSDAKKLKLNSNFLIIEDEEISSNVCTSMLDHLEFKSTLAKDGKTGIQKYLEFKSEITCVILDVSLPEIDGIEVYSMIRKLDGNIPILLTSGYSLGQISLDISADTQTTFLQKPYTMKQLQDSLNTIIKTDGANE